MTLAAVLVLAIHAAFALAPAPRYVPTRIEVDVTALLPAAGEMDESVRVAHHEAVLPDLARALHHAGVPVVQPERADDRALIEGFSVPAIPPGPSDARLRLRLTWENFDAGTYAIHVDVTRPGVAPRAVPALVCGPGCASEDLVARIERDVAPILALLIAAAPAEPVREETVVDRVPLRGSPADPVSRPRALRIAGSVALAVGGVAVVLGAILVGTGRQIDHDGAYDRVIDHAPPGWGLLVPGVVVTATGIGLLSATRTRAEHGTAFVPAPLVRFHGAEWTAWGLSLGGRF